MQKERRFAFISFDFPADTFQVVRFNGEEGLSNLYRFEIDLISKEKDLDLGDILQSPAQFKIFREDGVALYNGILEEFDQLHYYEEYTFYRAVLVPKLWWLSQTYHNQVFLNKSISEILKDILQDGGLLETDFEFRIQEEYKPLEYVCQYNETHLNFFQRWLAREGMYYFFEQGEHSEKLIITDTRMGHNVFSEGENLTYVQFSGLDDIHREEIVYGFYCRQRRMPKNLRLRNYDYEKSLIILEGESEVSEDGLGTIYQYGEYFKDNTEGKRLAKIKAESLKCKEKIFKGQSTVPYIRPGYFFNLKNHYRRDFNKRYLVINTYHEGSQAAYLISGLSVDLKGIEKENYYRNEFEAIESTLQFRTEEYKEKPKFYGFLNAKIDAKGSGEYAEIDDQGRYKVILPFDISGSDPGKGSAPLRMMQPYSGPKEGMHFPLRKGTEVLLAFIDGDPDRPVIAGTVPNPDTPSPVTAENQTMCKINTHGGNKIHIENEEGKQKILFHTPTQGSFIRLGAGGKDPGLIPNSDNISIPNIEKVIKEQLKANGSEILDTAGDEISGLIDKVKKLWDDSGKPGGVRLFSLGPISLTAARKDETFLGSSASTILGMRSELTIGSHSLTTIISSTTNRLGGHETFKSWRIAFIPFYNNFAGIVKKITGINFKVASEETKVVEAEEANIAAVKNELSENQATIAAEVMKLKGELTELRGEVTKLEGENTALQGEVTELSGEVTKLAGETTELKGEVTEIKGEQTKIMGELTKIAGEETSLAGESTEMAGEKIVF
ncbi:type VI secretion system secreted protein VgrG [Desulfonauticus submarinus]|uniref:Type VI secretion system secreted protein VgrG n=1 Tax=Desulfonauticus submarinus TaxID=206665 RepID=A0A1G9ZV95_9BACT|nr:type VI secretion system tip protein TssI/VgrG [Desulfonauticus submarinus]SDN24891.1 type VI secretion system secreted protein VgrG [Desulfonauticus submarinus]